jgi:hypothetical protein
MLAAGSLAAQPLKTVDHTMNTVLPPSAHKDVVLVFKPTPPNTIVGQRVVYSGIAVQAVKTTASLQLINPFAPAEYGSGTDNLERDVMTGKPKGDFKIFSVSF